MTSCYIDTITYQNANTGLVLAPLIGNSGRLAASSAGVTALTLIAPTTVALNQYDAVYVTDGPTSEVVKVGAGGAAIGSLSIPLQSPAAFAHAGGTAYCTDGIQGSVGQAIFEASQWLEDICHQALWLTTYAGEKLTMPTMRAALDNQWNLHFRPRHFPITTLTSVIVQTNAVNSTTYDTTQAIIDSDQQTVDIAALAIISTQQGGSQSSPWNWTPFNRQTTAWLTLTYSAGYAVGAMPWAVTRAATLLTSDSLGQLENPFGVDELQQNKRRATFTLRGDTSGESLLYKAAEKALSPYITQSF